MNSGWLMVCWHVLPVSRYNHNSVSSLVLEMMSRGHYDAVQDKSYKLVSTLGEGEL